MSAKIISGTLIANKIKLDLAASIQNRTLQGLPAPGLAVIIVGNDPASQIYVKKKRETCREIGITSHDYNLPATCSENQLLKLITTLNLDPVINGILIQLPLPKQINSNKILEQIAPDKDVDGFHPSNIGKLSLGQEALKPCTPKGIMALLAHTKISLQGKVAVVIGASNIVGKPTAMELINAQCTVTICQNSTSNLPEIVKQAEIVISATGVPQMVKAFWIKPGAAVIDVGITRLANGRLVGDIDFDEVKEVAGFITPVPGGVGPMTVAALMENTVYAATVLQNAI